MSRDTNGEKNPFFGKKHSEETKNKISESKKGVPSNSSTKFKKGHVPHTWKGGKTQFLAKQRLEMDNFTCQICGLVDKEIMQVDHIKPKVLFPELAFEIDNLRCICPNCHERKSRKERNMGRRKNMNIEELRKIICR